ncbi:Cytochrome c oxidase subunit 7A [Entomophthora muscae]|uniref:Cytochrome c oxidase subunit 7A n=1 Tax=Entomophthora muscae TaxID=34485 RepID=A0ACC2UT64_9FUNG|nr:Cytochrome c oxidase subunit 7A [Entomophthora muscae]
MAIAPITGRLARTIKIDLIGSISLSLAVATGYWHLYANPTSNKIDEFYVKLEAEKKLKKAGNPNCLFLSLTFFRCIMLLCALVPRLYQLKPY